MKHQILFLSLIILLIAGCKSKTQSLSVIEIIGDGNINPDKLRQICLEENPDESVYQWKNHLVAYGVFQHIEQLKSNIQKAYPGTTLKLYDKPFYEFNRKMATIKQLPKNGSYHY